MQPAELPPRARAATSTPPARDARGSAALGAILLLHRYLAVAVGALMTLWCLSGFVMMYQGYPWLTDAERLQGLAPLDLSGCCNAAALPFADEAPAADVRVEMLLGTPVLRVSPGFGGATPAAGTFDLVTGASVPELDAAQILAVAAEYARGHRIDGEPRWGGIVEVDQWTVQTARRNRPAYRVIFDDAARTEIYVSGASGEVFQDTNRRERVLAWLGAVPHWLYLTQLRRNGSLWSQVVISTSLVGTFLTVTGLYVGIARLKRRRDGRLGSPFRGWWYWHHVSGLVFGVLTLTWVFSGLMTMNPWGTLLGTGAFDYVRTIKGAATWRDVKQFLDAAPERLAGSGTVQIASAVFDGRFYAVAFAADGTRSRLDETGWPALLAPAEIDAAIARIGVPVAEAVLLEGEDSFYYGHKNDAELPVYRVILADEERTRLYVNPVTGAVRGIDATMRAARWIRTGLHDLDFAGLRVRPVWDVVVGLLLAGVTATCVTGTWLAFKRVRLDYRRVRRAFAQRAVARALTAFFNR